MTSLTSGEGLRQHLGGERGLGARARRCAVLLLQVVLRRVVVLAQHVSPAAVQEAVQDVRGDDVRQGQRLLRFEARLQAQRGSGEHGAHGEVEGAGVREELQLNSHQVRSEQGSAGTESPVKGGRDQGLCEKEMLRESSEEIKTRSRDTGSI